MNKANWITVALDGSVPDDTIRMLLDMSFETTAVKVRRRNYKSPPIQKSQN
jgi:predicted DNA-binding protein (MmcQ/YjbR family)